MESTDSRLDYWEKKAALAAITAQKKQNEMALINLALGLSK
jgi:hypothetical protein